MEDIEQKSIEIYRHGEKEILNRIESIPETQIDEAFSKLDTDLAAQPKEPGWHFPRINFKSPRMAVIVLALFASMGGMLSGLDQSVISGANLFMPEALNLTKDQASLVNAGMPLGAIGGALILSPVNEKFGRRRAILLAIAFYTVGAALMAGAVNFGMMMAGRVILGAGVGLEGGTVPVYVAESVPSNVRGRIVSLYQFNIALGEVFGYVVSAIFVNVKGNWRYILGSSLLFSTIMGVGMLMLPETPRWLIHKGRELDSYRVFISMRGHSRESKIEFLEMKAAYAAEQAESETTRRFPWLDFFTVPRCRRALVYANIMIFLGQFTGVNAIMYYMSVLLTQVGFTKQNAVFMSLVGGGALLIGTTPAILFMDRAGRRFWANFMLPGFFVGLVLVFASYFADLKTQVGQAQGFYITGLILYMGFFGPYACLTWVIPSEVYPTYLRSYGMTTSAATLFTWTFLVTYNFTRMQEAMTNKGLALGFYGGIAVVGWIYQVIFMPETSGRTLEEIDDVFSRSTGSIAAENIRNAKMLLSDLFHFRFKKAMSRA